MIGKIDINQLPLEPSSSSGQLNATNALSGNDADVSVQVQYAHLVEKAMQLTQTDTERVQQARELLLSGQLERPENIQKAAENIVTFGI